MILPLPPKTAVFLKLCKIYVKIRLFSFLTYVLRLKSSLKITDYMKVAKLPPLAPLIYSFLVTTTVSPPKTTTKRTRTSSGKIFLYKFFRLVVVAQLLYALNWPSICLYPLRSGGKRYFLGSYSKQTAKILVQILTNKHQICYLFCLFVCR